MTNKCPCDLATENVFFNVAIYLSNELSELRQDSNSGASCSSLAVDLMGGLLVRWSRARDGLDKWSSSMCNAPDCDSAGITALALNLEDKLAFRGFSLLDDWLLEAVGCFALVCEKGFVTPVGFVVDVLLRKEELTLSFVDETPSCLKVGKTEETLLLGDFLLEPAAFWFDPSGLPRSFLPAVDLVERGGGVFLVPAVEDLVVEEEFEEEAGVNCFWVSFLVVILLSLCFTNFLSLVRGSEVKLKEAGGCLLPNSLPARGAECLCLSDNTFLGLPSPSSMAFLGISASLFFCFSGPLRTILFLFSPSGDGWDCLNAKCVSIFILFYNATNWLQQPTNLGIPQSSQRHSTFTNHFALINNR